MLLGFKKVMVAFSGGIDSTFLLKRAIDELGEGVTAVLVKAESFPDWEFDEAQKLGKSLKVKLVTTNVNDFDNPNILANPVNRCYYCKEEFFGHLNELASELDIPYVLDGTNADDLGDYRPGLLAKKEKGIISPLADVKLTKDEIRELSRELSLPNWDKPSFACLNSRIPFGSPITPEKISQIDKAEFFLKSLGFKQVRVRHHDEIARIEVLTEDFEKLLKRCMEVTKKLKELGFLYITLDLNGFESGSMNKKLTHGNRRAD